MSKNRMRLQWLSRARVCQCVTLLLAFLLLTAANAASNYSFTSINFPGADYTHAYGINDAGQIVGFYASAGHGHGFLLSGGSFSRIDFPGASGTVSKGINNAGQIVGTYSGGDEVGHGFLLSAGTSTTIDFPGAVDTEINGGINNMGQIVGYYRNADGTIHGFLTTPVPIANAGADQTVNEGGSVVLDGSASTGQNLSFSWAQLAGPAVVLSGATSAQPTFTAPQLPGGFGSQVLTFRLTVNSGGSLISDTVDVTVKNVNHAPEAHAGADQTVKEGSLVILDGGASFDPDGDAITYQWIQTGGTPVTLIGSDTANPTFIAPILPGGVGGSVVLRFSLVISDGALSATGEVQVTVEQDNHAPIANAGDPQTVRPWSVVTLNGALSYDPDNDPFGYQWVQVSGPSVTLQNATSAMPGFTAPQVGTTTMLAFRLTTSDGQLFSSPDDVVITVINGPPLCNLAQAVPSLLWPPNHGMKVVGVTGVTDPNNDSVTITITGVTQDEPVNGVGDGDTSPDAVIQGSQALLRAERWGGGNGRVYQVNFSANDGQGGVCSGSVKVTVPHSMKPGSAAVDDGQLYDSTQ